MKTKVFKLRFFSLLICFGVLTSCSKEDSVSDQENSQDLIVEQSRQATEVDVSSEDVFSLIETAYAEIEEDEGRNASLFPDCVIITISSENDVVFVTLDFGFGCELQNGALVSGKVHLTYGPVQNGTRTINYQLESFTYNEKGIEGSGTIFRERNNASGNPQSTIHLDIIVSFQNGAVADVSGTRVREWIEGVGSGTWMDNVFLVTGNRSIEFNTGFTHDALVTSALRRETTCPFFVSGLIEITRNSTDGMLNFGAGDCDNLAVLTVNGVDYTIILN